MDNLNYLNNEFNPLMDIVLKLSGYKNHYCRLRVCTVYTQGATTSA